MDGNPDRGINESDRIRNLHNGTKRRSGNKNSSSGDVRRSEYDPFLHSPSQRRSPDGFPRLSGNDQKPGPPSDLALGFWSQGVANWRALQTRSNGSKKNSNSTALIKEPSNPPTARDTAGFAPTHSRDQLPRSGVQSFVESDAISAPPSGVDHLARPVPDSPVAVFDEIPEYKHEPLRPSPGKFMGTAAPDVGASDQPSELKAQTLPSIISARGSKSPTKSCGGKEYDASKGADAMSLHAGRSGSTVMSHVEIEDGETKHAILTDPALSTSVYSSRGWGSGLSLQKQPFTPPKPSQVPKHDESSSAKATPHFPKPQSVTPITPTRNPRIRHPKSLSAEAAAFHPRLPSRSPTTPTRSYGNGDGKSVSFGNGHPNTGYVSVMPNTRFGQRSLWPPRQTSSGTPSVPVESSAFQDSGGGSQSFSDPHYPEPQQHTPGGQGQYFDIPVLMTSQMPTQSCHSLGPNIPPFPSSIHSCNNNMIHYNAQVYGQGEQNAEYSQSNHFDSYPPSQVANAVPNAADLHQNGNMYTQDTNGYGPRYYSNHTDPSHQLNQNLYTPLEPHREPSKPNQRTAKELFIPEDLRLKLHARTEATLRVFAVSNTPTVEHYHTLTPLTSVNQQQSQTLRGYSSTIYKAVSAKDGRTYCLRRIHDFRATNLNENAIFAVRQKWAAVRNSNVVSLHFAFTTTNFDSSSLVIVSDYHPDSKTVAEKHFNQTPSRPNRNAPPLISEQTLWSYIVQITNALKAVHSAQLAVRVIEPSKVIVTDENRIRLNGCALEDLLVSEIHDIADLQRLDFHKFGNFILAVGTNNMSNSSSRARTPDVFAQNYSKTSPQLKIVVEWLLDHDRPENHEGIDVLIKLISSNAIDTFDKSLHSNDHLYFSLNKEIENSRLVRLMTKLSCLNERPEYENDRTYTTQGSRAVLGLFRDYVFHQVDAQANPVVDLGHILSCLNKLDAGIEERIALTSRDEQSVIVVSYKELKGALEGTWQELVRRSTG